MDEYSLKWEVESGLAEYNLNEALFDAVFETAIVGRFDDEKIDNQNYSKADVRTLVNFIKNEYGIKKEQPPKETSPEAELKLQNFTGSNKELDGADEWQIRNILYLSLLYEVIEQWKAVEPKSDNAIELAARYLSFITGWNEREAKEYLTENKTPGLSPIPYNVELSYLRLGHPGRITLTIDPRVDPEDVRKTYNRAVSELKKWTHLSRRRHEKHNLELIKFVLETPGLSWQERFKKWQKEYPEYRNKWQNAKTMEGAYKRAWKTLLKGSRTVHIERWLREAKEDLLLTANGQLPIAFSVKQSMGQHTLLTSESSHRLAQAILKVNPHRTSTKRKREQEKEVSNGKHSKKSK